jgi:hypothetical protein
VSRTILTHVGTSIKTKHVDGNTTRERHWENTLKGHAGARQSLSETVVEHLNTVWTDNELARRAASSGELASLSLLDLRPDDCVVLLHSDTDDGRLAAWLLQQVMLRVDKPGFPGRTSDNLDVKQINGMKVPDGTEATTTEQDRQDFVRDGLVDYVDKVWSEFRRLSTPAQDDAANHRFIINITGGYKGMIPMARDLALLLTAISTQRVAAGQAHPIDCSLCYLYEGGHDLIWYGSYPVGVVWNAPYFTLLEDATNSNRITAAMVRPYPALFEPDGQNPEIRRPSPLGTVLREVRARLYAQQEQ